MMRRRLFPSPIWGAITYSQDFNQTSFIGTTGVSGSSYRNLQNLGGATSTTYGSLTFSTTKQKTSGFQFRFDINTTNIPQSAVINNVEINFKWGFTGSLGNGGSSLGYARVYDANNVKVYESSSFSQRNVPTDAYTVTGDKTQFNRQNIENIMIEFEGTAGNGKYNNPTIQFYGATITVNYHIRAI